eukprot:TRINITY_DN1782_c0_g1_i1.p1 TRINITY_DN1782_c0_g1~~TRINITY_DN1782_c0_g1_i1.p1  ORF type:complete len:228 (+),score=119.53 TRINITY_DN1782_c0_g1_i1:27-686(+)
MGQDSSKARHKVSKKHVKQLQKTTNLNRVEITELSRVFEEVAAGAPGLNREQFQLAFQKLSSTDPNVQSIAGIPYANRLFDLLDTDKSNTVDIREFVAGLSVLCKGTTEEKLLASFRAFDLDGDGFISFDELSQMFTSAWLAGYSPILTQEADEETKREIREFSVECAINMARSVMNAIDVNGDGKLSLEEFKMFARQNPKITATLDDYENQVSLVFGN